ncbi:uncharacterized protein BXZ73DRAFT_103429 [Epithele typhae]|uniref:uncharacterized protein n=1 Tax=Epithele typhae TaxID=378194 RepID=UPI0020079D57|nr:uncharacterized protein BXZ73DRAFT_103429 [Epithele typhae]KAH9925059.1 hypothetical protein BXZ73DRAFT_103429 [Epithele typhae]
MSDSVDSTNSSMKNIEYQGLTSREVLIFLESMDIKTPPGDTTFRDGALSSRLRAALRYAQYIHRLPPLYDLLKSSTEWKKLSEKTRKLCRAAYVEPAERGLNIFSEDDYAAGDPNEKPISLECERGPTVDIVPLMESCRGMEDRGQKRLAYLYVRFAIRRLAFLVDCGTPWVVWHQDEDKDVFVNVRVATMRAMRGDIPAFVILYRAYGPSDPSKIQEGKEWARKQDARFPLNSPNPKERGNTFPLSRITLQILLSVLLPMNERLLPDSLPIRREPGEEDYLVSVLFPCGPLLDDTTSELSARWVCVMCGSGEVKECARCRAVAYCSTSEHPPRLASLVLIPRPLLRRAECQYAHWKTHRPGCVPRPSKGHWAVLRAREDWIWTRPELIGLPADADKTAGLRRLAGERFLPKYDGQVPRNVWGVKPFVVRIAIPDGDRKPWRMFVGDRRRSFEFCFAQWHDEALFAQLVGEMRGPRGGHGGKVVYRWAKRAREMSYLLCVDHVPAAELNWCDGNCVCILNADVD